MLKEGSFKGRTIIVTGGATGLGKSMATYLSELGANIVICSRKENNLLKSAEDIIKHTTNPVLPVVCDVRNTDQIQNVIDQSFKKSYFCTIKIYFFFSLVNIERSVFHNVGRYSA